MHGADITFQSLIGGPITLLNYVPVQEIYVNDITFLPFYKCIRDTSQWYNQSCCFYFSSPLRKWNRKLESWQNDKNNFDETIFEKKVYLVNDISLISNNLTLWKKNWRCLIINISKKIAIKIAVWLLFY